MSKWYKVNDGWFDFFVNIETGEKKLHLDEDDIEVMSRYDDEQIERIVGIYKQRGEE